MKKFALLVVLFTLMFGMLLPGGRTTSDPAIAQVEERGLFEAAPYKETQLERKYDGHFYVEAQVNGTPVHFMVDTGATSVALTQEDARKIGLKFSPEEFVPVARTANGIANGKKTTLRMVAIEGKEVPEVDALIMENGGMSLLGQAYLARISGVEMSGDSMVLR